MIEVVLTGKTLPSKENKSNEVELKVFESGSSKVTFTVMDSHNVAKKGEEPNWINDFYNCEAWSNKQDDTRLIDDIIENFKPGTHVIVWGELKPEVYTKDGEERRVNKLIVRKVALQTPRKDKTDSPKAAKATTTRKSSVPADEEPFN